MPGMYNITPAYDQLTPVERVFVDGYVSGLENAARERGERLGAALNRSIPHDHIAASQGMLERPLVVAAIYTELKARSEERDLSPQRLVAEYQAIAFSNMKHYIDIEPAYAGAHALQAPVINLTHLTDEQWSAISEVTMDYHNTGAPKSVRIKLHNKMDALAKLGEYMAVLYRDNEYWKQETAAKTRDDLPHDIGVDETKNRYARMIAG